MDKWFVNQEPSACRNRPFFVTVDVEANVAWR
jgi:hypothetical protein